MKGPLRTCSRIPQQTRVHDGRRLPVATQSRIGVLVLKCPATAESERRLLEGGGVFALLLAVEPEALRPGLHLSRLEQEREC